MFANVTHLCIIHACRVYNHVYVAHQQTYVHTRTVMIEPVTLYSPVSMCIRTHLNVYIQLVVLLCIRTCVYTYIYNTYITGRHEQCSMHRNVLSSCKLTDKDTQEKETPMSEIYPPGTAMTDTHVYTYRCRYTHTDTDR
jgi:hypothetical protein